MAYNQNQFNKEYSERLKQSRQIGQAASSKPYTIEQYIESTSVKKQQKTPRWTSDDLYDLAVQSGLKNQADTILAQKGEETNQIFSGGWISDIFDALNALQYGVVGMLKGKSFIEGLRSRESFSKQDSLGDYGIPGMIAGMLLDIAVDPLTYIAPWTLLKKVPGVTKGLKAIKEATFGKMVTKTIQETPELESAIEAGKKIADAVPEARTYQTVEGGTKIGRWLGDRFVYRFGQDPVFAELDDRRVRNILVDYQNVMESPANMLNLSDKSAKWALKVGKDGRIARTSPDVLQKLVDAGELTQDEFNIIQKANNSIINLGQAEVDLGILSKEKFEENINDYLHNFYKEHLKKPPSKEFGYKQIGIKGTKKRVKGLTPEKMEKLGQVKNPAYLYLRTQIEMIKDIENAKFFKLVNERFASNVAQEGFKQLPVSGRLMTTFGKRTEILSNIKKVNNDLKPVFKELNKTFNADKKTLSLIKNTEKELNLLARKEAEKLTEFFQAGKKITKETLGSKRLGTLPDELVGIAQDIKKFSKFDDVLNSKTGIKLEKLFLDGVLERNGFKSMKDFFNYIKEPFKKTLPKQVETTAKGNIPRIIKLQKRIEKLAEKSEKLRNIDKRSIDDAYRYLDDLIENLSIKKEKAIYELEKTKLGDLAGKWVPEHIYNAIQEVTKPIDKTLGNKVIGAFKYSKVVLNPATHARNIVSNSILNWWKLGMNPADPRVISVQAEAAKQIAKGGKWVDEAKPLGYNLNTFATNELPNLLESPEAYKVLGSKAGKLANKISNIYQGEEGFAKLSAYIFSRKYKGMAPEEAWKAAESATFNYAQVTPFVRQLRTSLWGYPFITFPLKATPVAIETMAKHPGRVSVFGKIKQSIENQADITETAAERASEPSWVRDGFYIKLPIKDSEGRSAYFDLTYIIPFGDLVSGTLFTRQVSRETGLPESVPETLLSPSPVFNALKEIHQNQDFYGNKIWKESDPVDKQLKDLFTYVSKTFLPTPIAEQLPGGYKTTGEKQPGRIQRLKTPKTEPDQQRTMMEEMLRNVGLKIQPIDLDIQETYMEAEKKRALERLLTEAGILSEFKTVYIPKE